MDSSLSAARSPAAEPSGATRPRASTATFVARHLAIGIYFGFVLIKSEVASWYRIQEMFRFDAFHMYGTIGAALAVAAAFVWIVRRLGWTDAEGRSAYPPSPDVGWRRYAFGGTLFGIGWALTGACPGPIAALIGAGLWPFTIVFVAAWAGTAAYGAVEPRLPH